MTDDNILFINIVFSIICYLITRGFVIFRYDPEKNRGCLGKMFMEFVLPFTWPLFAAYMIGNWGIQKCKSIINE